MIPLRDTGVDARATFESDQRGPGGELLLIIGPSTTGARFGLKPVGTARYWRPVNSRSGPWLSLLPTSRVGENQSFDPEPCVSGAHGVSVVCHPSSSDA